MIHSLKNIKIEAWENKYAPKWLSRLECLSTASLTPINAKKVSGYRGSVAMMATKRLESVTPVVNFVFKIQGRHHQNSKTVGTSSLTKRTDVFHKFLIKQECIPVGCVLPTAVAISWGCLSECWDTTPLGVGLETLLGVGLDTPLQVWAWIPPWVWAWRPPWPDPSSSPLGVGLETSKACWDTPSPETCKTCWDTTTPL